MMAPGLLFAVIAAAVASVVAAAPLDAPVETIHAESKPMGPIGVDVHLAALPALGVPLAVTITALADARAVGHLELTVRADDSAALVIAAQSGPLDRAGSRSWVVTVVPIRASGADLSVVVSGEIEGVAQAQSVVTRVRPAGAESTVRALAIVPAQSGGENLSLLPVEERF